MRLFSFFMFFFISISTIIPAIEPDEKLNDPELEKTARHISKQLRCLVCQNEDIDSSNADIAKDLRLLIRNKLLEGKSKKDCDSIGSGQVFIRKSKKEIIDYVHSRYGDFILFSPPFRRDTIGLWVLPISFLILLSYLFFKKKNKK